MLDLVLAVHMLAAEAPDGRYPTGGPFTTSALSLDGGGGTIARPQVLHRGAALGLDLPVLLAQSPDFPPPGLDEPELPAPRSAKPPARARAKGAGPRGGEALAGAATMLGGDALLAAIVAALAGSPGGSDGNAVANEMAIVVIGAVAMVFATPGFAVMGVRWASDGDGNGAHAYLFGLGAEAALALAAPAFRDLRPAWGVGGLAAGAAATLVAVPFAASWGWHAGTPDPRASPAERATPEAAPRAGPRPVALALPLAVGSW
ncbi:MAG TPA: hypothetical protein VLU43_13625 [Anaeromyxobacteraceae bacterium]|nr:hypothetical protein [Anaeromyxobacteraceae bacterium]